MKAIIKDDKDQTIGEHELQGPPPPILWWIDRHYHHMGTITDEQSGSVACVYRPAKTSTREPPRNPQGTA